MPTTTARGNQKYATALDQIIELLRTSDEVNVGSSARDRNSGAVGERHPAPAFNDKAAEAYVAPDRTQAMQQDVQRLQGTLRELASLRASRAEEAKEARPKKYVALMEDMRGRILVLENERTKLMTMLMKERAAAARTEEDYHPNMSHHDELCCRELLKALSSIEKDMRVDYDLDKAVIEQRSAAKDKEIATLKRELKTKGSSHESDLSSLRARLHHAEEEQRTAQKSRRELLDQIDSQEDEILTLQKELRTANKHAEVYEAEIFKLEADLADIRAELDQCRARAAEIQAELMAQRSLSSQYHNSADEREIEAQRLREEIEGLKEDLHFTRSEEQHLHKEVTRLKGELANERREATTSHAELDSLEDRLEDANKLVDELKKDKLTHERELQRVLEEHRNNRSENERRIAELEEEVVDLKAELERLNDERADGHLRLANKEDEFEDLEDELEKSKAELAATAAELATTNNFLEAREADLEEEETKCTQAVEALQTHMLLCTSTSEEVHAKSKQVEEAEERSIAATKELELERKKRARLQAEVDALKEAAARHADATASSHESSKELQERCDAAVRRTDTLAKELEKAKEALHAASAAVPEECEKCHDLEVALKKCQKERTKLEGQLHESHSWVDELTAQNKTLQDEASKTCPRCGRLEEKLKLLLVENKKLKRSLREAYRPTKEQISARARIEVLTPYMGMEVLEGPPIGVVIRGVKDNSPAEVGGLKKNDLVFKVGDQETNTWEDLRGALAEAAPGEVVEFVLERDGARMELNVQFGAKGIALDELKELRAAAGKLWCKYFDEHCGAHRQLRKSHSEAQVSEHHESPARSPERRARGR